MITAERAKQLMGIQQIELIKRERFNKMKIDYNLQQSNLAKTNKENNCKMISQTNKCAICAHPMYYHNQQFYCCNRNQRYCIICRGKNCKTCNRLIDKVYEMPSCKLCYSRSEAEYFTQPNCQVNYCPKYLITRLPSLFASPFVQSPPTLTLPCSHSVSTELLMNFYKGKYCILCGRKYSAISDCDLADGNKCCYQCYRFEKAKLQMLLMFCVSCGKQLKKKSDVGINNDGLILCLGCAKAACWEEERHELQMGMKKIQKQKKHEEQMKMEQTKDTSQKKQVNNYLIDNSKPKDQQTYHIKIIPNPQSQPQQVHYQPEIYSEQKKQGKEREKQQKLQKQKQKQKQKEKQKQKKPVQLSLSTQSQSQQNNSQSNNSKSKSKSKEKSPTNKNNVAMKQGKVENLFRNFQKEGSMKNLGQFKQVQSLINVQVGQNKPQLDRSQITQPLGRTILQQFPSQKQQPSPFPKRTIKKHLSIQTYIQKLKLQLPSNTDSASSITTCKQCQYDILLSQSFSIQDSLHQINRYCRLCYTMMTNKQLLGFGGVGAGLGFREPLDKSRNVRGTSNQKYREPTHLLMTPSADNKQQPYYPTTVNVQKNLHPNSLLSPAPMKKSDILDNYAAYTSKPVPSSFYNSIRSPTQSTTTQNSNTSTSLTPGSTHEKISAGVRVSQHRYVNKQACMECKSTGGSLIRTGNRGAICFSCYYKKK